MIPVIYDKQVDTGRNVFEITAVNKDEADDKKFSISPVINLPYFNFILWKIFAVSMLFKEADGFILSNFKVSNELNCMIELFYEANKFEGIGLIVVEDPCSRRFTEISLEELNAKAFASVFISSTLIDCLYKQSILSDKMIIRSVVDEKTFLDYFRSIGLKVYKMN